MLINQGFHLSLQGVFALQTLMKLLLKALLHRGMLFKHLLQLMFQGAAARRLRLQIAPQAFFALLYLAQFVMQRMFQTPFFMMQASRHGIQAPRAFPLRVAAMFAFADLQCGELRQFLFQLPLIRGFLR